MWRITVGLSDTIEYLFMLTGHTKFAPDRFFGLFKRAYDTSDNIIRVVKESSVQGKNIP